MMSVLEVATAKALLTRANYASRNTFHKDNEILKMNLDLSKDTILTVDFPLFQSIYPELKAFSS
jgi:hypothetical protein